MNSLNSKKSVSGAACADSSIWWFAFGYFAAYAPYSALTKALSDGLLPGMARKIYGFELLPITAIASLLGMFVFISAMGWWKFAGKKKIFGLNLPCPNRWTFLSGLCTAAIIPTTTLAYTFTGVSIVFMMLLMRGGVLVIAPIVDFFSRRKVQWYSWVALLLALSALFVGFAGKGFEMTFVAGLTVAIYLAAYFVRLRFMSHRAKSEDPNASRRYFVEEQMTATPALVIMLSVLGWIGHGDAMLATRGGFTTFFDNSLLVVAVAFFVGILSQGTGIFGGLILLDKRENTFCVPVNRASSVLAGVVATLGLWFFAGKRPPATSEFVGAGLIVLAILVLSFPTLFGQRIKAFKAARAARQASAELPVD